jgi:hypothetical protein
VYRTDYEQGATLHQTLGLPAVPSRSTAALASA